MNWETPEKHGGADIVDFRFNAIITEEFRLADAVGWASLCRTHRVWLAMRSHYGSGAAPGI
nr:MULTISPECIES: hypothetical protein [unclassified Mycobacterium]